MIIGPRQIKVICVGPAIKVRGGISTVIGHTRNRFPAHIRFRIVPTFSEYTGNDEPARGSRLIQAGVFLAALCRISATALIWRRTVFHVHLSEKGSTIRKGLVCIVLRALRCRYIVHAHAATDALFHPWVPLTVRRLLLWGIGGSECFLALTQFWAQYYATALKSHATQIVVLPNPVELPAEIPERSDRDGLRLLFLGRIGDRKGAFEVIRAFGALPPDVRNRCSLTLAGDGELEAARALAATLGCPDRVSIPGWVDRSEVVRLLGEAEVLLLPSRGEGMSNALLEGMAWGLAVVTSAAGGADEFLHPGVDAILVEPGDTDAIRTAIAELDTNPAFRVSLGLAARKTAGRFCIEGYVDRLSRLYESLASTPRT